jgi:integrase
MCGLSVWVASAVPGAAVPGWATVGRVRRFEHYPDDRLKTDCSRTRVPIPPSLTLGALGPRQTVLNRMADDRRGRRPDGAVAVAAGFPACRAPVDDLPEGFRFHDLRHAYASLLIASGLDVKTVQTRMRHASAKTTLDCLHAAGP